MKICDCVNYVAFCQCLQAVYLSVSIRMLVASRDDVLSQCSDHQTIVSGFKLAGPLADLQKTARQRYC